MRFPDNIGLMVSYRTKRVGMCPSASANGVGLHRQSQDSQERRISRS